MNSLLFEELPGHIGTIRLYPLAYTISFLHFNLNSVDTAKLEKNLPSLSTVLCALKQQRIKLTDDFIIVFEKNIILKKKWTSCSGGPKPGGDISPPIIWLYLPPQHFQYVLHLHPLQ